MMRRFVASLVLLALAPLAARADPDPESPLGTHPGRPARQDATQALVLSAVRQGTPEPADLARTLGVAGGRAAAEGLAELIERGGSDARVPALEAAKRVGLRHRPLVHVVRRTAREQGGAELRAAVAALGAIGDGRDVPRLLDLAASDDPLLRATAFDALGALTGATVPPVLARWTWYHRTVKRRAERVVPAAIRALEDAPRGEDVERHLRLLLRYGWAEPALIHETVYAWLIGSDPHLRRIACEIVADLRLADHADLVESTHRIATQGALREEAARTLAVLGVPQRDAASE